jgi:surfactin synthase thioesterase subunit
VHENYTASTDEPVSVPVCSIRGSNDGLVSAEQAQELRKATSSDFSFIELPGDHMYLADRAQEVLGLIEGQIRRRLISRCRPPA